MNRGFNFNSIPAPKLKRTAFDLSRENKVTLPMGKLIPIMCQEGLPGDTFKISPAALTRFMALTAPIMHRVDVKMEFFKVPIRLLYKDWESFLTGGADGTEAPHMPTFNLQSLSSDDDAWKCLDTNSLADYLGIPLPYTFNSSTGVWSKLDKDSCAVDQEVSLLPFSAYHKIYNDYYRDQNIIDEVTLLDESQEYTTPSTLTKYLQLHRRAWKKDYFTSALNDPQRGTAVGINLAGSAPVTVDKQHSEFSLYSDDAETVHEGNLLALDRTTPGVTDHKNYKVANEDDAYYGWDLELGPLSGSADLSNVSVIGVTALRTAFKLQQFLERNNIAGSRLVENILAHFGVKSSDARLQRAEFIGGSSVPVMISEVASTAATENAPLADLAGKAKSAGGFGTFSTFCEEHCIIMGIMSVIPSAGYAQGLPRMFTRFDKFDYFWPEFQHIGEQAIKNKELFLDYGTAGHPEKNDLDFGYQARYSDYKYNPDEIHGDFKTSLSYWHMARLFTSTPSLNKEFIECKPTDRIFAVSDSISDEKVVSDIWLDVKAIRPMAKYSTPYIS